MKNINYSKFTRLRGFFVKSGLISLLAVFMVGCATTYEIDDALIKDFQEPVVAENKTGIYVIRGDNFVGGGRGLWVAVNDGVVADLSNGSHVYLELDAGLNTLHFVQAKAGFGYLAVDNKPGETLYARFDYGSEDGLTEVLDIGLGQTMALQTKALKPLEEKKNNDAYDNLLINPGVLNYPIMTESPEMLTADEDHAIVRFYRPDTLIESWAFDVWNQEGYIGSTKGGSYFSVKLKPGHHVFIARSERYSILDAELEAGKEYAVELDVGMGWNQAHIKLLPINLNKNKGKNKIEKWQKNLESMVVDQHTVEMPAVADRIKMGFNYLDSTRKSIHDGDIPKRDLPAAFGK